MPGEGPLNHNCGAEHVQKNRTAPRIYTKGLQSAVGTNEVRFFASLDGDADRIVFHFKNNRNGDEDSFHLLDGDKIAVLVAKFIQDELTSLGQFATRARNIRCGVVQTAYANGASTLYLSVRSLLFPVSHTTGFPVAPNWTHILHISITLVFFVARHQDQCNSRENGCEVCSCRCS